MGLFSDMMDEAGEKTAEIARLRLVVQHESDCVEAAKSEIERLRAALDKIIDLSDLEMADGDGARRIATAALTPRS